MLAPLATLAFLVTLWLVAGALLNTLAGSSGRIAAALKGRSLLSVAPPVAPVTVRVSQRPRSPRPLRAQPEWRAAA